MLKDHQIIMNNLISFYNEYVENLSELSNDDSRLSAVPFIVNTLLFSGGRITERDIDVIRILISTLSLIYNNGGVSPVSDTDYDSLSELLSSYDNGEQLIGAELLEGVLTAQHDYPDLRGSLDKVYSIRANSVYNTGIKTAKRSIEDWLDSITLELGSLNEEQTKAMVQPKYDGVSIEFSCDKDGNILKALTRGNVNTNEGLNVTKAFSHMKFSHINSDGKPFGLKTEVLMSRANFEKVSQALGYKTPLSATAGIINSSTTNPNKELMDMLMVVPLRLQRDGEEISTITTGFDTIVNLKNLDDIGAALEDTRASIEESIPIDGAVIILMDPEIRKKLGRKNHKSMYEIAYKFPPATGESQILDVQWQVGLLGHLTPVAKIEPIRLKGKTIGSISLGSKDRFLALDLHRYDRVSIKYDIIPYLDKIDQGHIGEKFQLPTKCATCGSDLIGDKLICSNPKCESKSKGKILNFITKMGIEFISEATIETLYERGFLKSIEDIYALKLVKESLFNIAGFGKKSIERILKSIEDHRKVDLATLLGSIGIVSVGRKVMEKVFTMYNLEELMDIVDEYDVSRLAKVNGISGITAVNIIEGIRDNSELIQHLLTEVDIIEPSDEPRYDTTVYFTKVRDPKFVDFLKSNGIGVSDNFNKSVSYLIIKDKNSDSKKIGKYNIPVLTLEEAHRKFGYIS